MNYSNFYAADFGLESSNSSTLTLKYDDATTDASSPSTDSYGVPHNPEAMMSSKDNPVLTTASAPSTHTRNIDSGTRQENCMPDFGLDFDLCQDLKMPAMLLIDGRDDSSSTYSGGYSRDTAYYAPLADTAKGAIVNPTRGGGSHSQILHMQNPIVTAGIQDMWATDAPTFITKSEPLDDDVIFQVDKADLLQGTHFSDDPLLNIIIDDINVLEEGHTLQPLQNANSCTISPSGYFNMPYHQDLYQPQQHKEQVQQPFMETMESAAINFPPGSTTFYDMVNSSSSGNLNSEYKSPPSNSTTNQFRARSISMPHRDDASILAMRKFKANAASQHAKRSTLQDLLRRGQSLEVQPGKSILSSSVPNTVGIDQLWQLREPWTHKSSISNSKARTESTSSLSVGDEVWSEGLQDFSEDDSNHYEDVSSDSDDDELGASKGAKGGKIVKGNFWQYNVQAKGPKGQRLVVKTEMEDPHVLNEATDPVFSPDCSVRGIKHSGKARKGDGNVLTPNPRKLNAIGKELDKLFRVINDITPVSEVPFHVRTKTRKEKNKLASRACRLKKKAQHEANKIKLYGLEEEHKRLISGIQSMKLLANNPYNPTTQEEVAQKIDRVYQSASKVKIAGKSTEYVNQVIQKVKENDGSV